MIDRLRAKGIPWPAPSFFSRRVLMCMTLCLIAGIAASRFVPYTVMIWVAAPCLLLAALLLRAARKAALALLMVAMVLLGIGRGGMELQEPDLPPTGKWTVEGTVNGEVTNNGRAVMFFLSGVRVQSEPGGAWEAISGDLYCYYPTTTSSRLAHGQQVRVAGTSYLPTGARNPGAFDQKMWLAQKGAHARLYATSAPKIVQDAGLSIRGLALSLNASLGARMDRLFGQASPVIRAMVLGDQRGIPDDWSSWMSESGIAHLLAVSGLHVALWFVLLERLLRPLPVSPRVRWVLLAVLLAGYALLTGLRASVLRAVIMLLSLQGAHIARRKADPLTNLSLAAFVILIFRPLDLFAASFQLSFCAVLGIVLLRPLIKKLLPIKWEAPAEILYTSLAAQLGILPASSYWFGTVPLLGLLLNLVAIPITGVLIPIAALATLLDAIWAPLGWLFVQASQGMVAVLLLLARLTVSVPFAYMRIGAFAWWTAAAFFVAMLLCSTAVVWRWRTRAALLAGVTAIAVAVAFFSGTFQVRYVQLDVGQALSGVLHVGSKSYVYDTGNEGSDLTEYLLYTGSAVEGLFLSHPHADHIGGVSELMDTGIRVKTVYVPANADVFGAEPDYAAKLDRVREQGAQVVELAAGDTLNLGSVQATVVAPTREVTRGNDPNDRSLVLLMEIGEHLLMLMGDADGPAEPLGVDTDVLQVAHHGSRNAARPAFLADATPDIALISTGRNSYGHPNADTVQRLEDAGAEVYITRDTGAVTLYFWPDDIRVEAYAQ